MTRDEAIQRLHDMEFAADRADLRADVEALKCGIAALRQIREQAADLATLRAERERLKDALAKMPEWIERIGRGGLDEEGISRCYECRVIWPDHEDGCDVAAALASCAPADTETT